MEQINKIFTYGTWQLHSIDYLVLPMNMKHYRSKMCCVCHYMLTSYTSSLCNKKGENSSIRSDENPPVVFFLPSMEYDGVPSLPKRVILASTWYRGPGLESTDTTIQKQHYEKTHIEFIELHLADTCMQGNITLRK